jgi:hypothetical protein
MKRSAPIALSALALAATGCGSSGSSSLSDAAFTSKANAICAAANTANSKLSSTGVAGLKAEEALVAGTITKLQALPPPANRAAAFKSYITEVKYLDSVLQQLSSAVTAHDAAKIASIEAGVKGFENKGKTAARAAGIKSCD